MSSAPWPAISRSTRSLWALAVGNRQRTDSAMATALPSAARRAPGNRRLSPLMTYSHRLAPAPSEVRGVHEIAALGGPA